GRSRRTEADRTSPPLAIQIVRISSLPPKPLLYVNYGKFSIMPDKIRHPRGLSTLFFTEMWERFSYYGMRAFLILYMTAPVAAGGLGFDVPRASSVYGTYTGSVWVTPILGGLVADRMLGAYRSVLLGGIVIALGHFT